MRLTLGWRGGRWIAVAMLAAGTSLATLSAIAQDRALTPAERAAQQERRATPAESKIKASPDKAKPAARAVDKAEESPPAKPAPPKQAPKAAEKAAPAPAAKKEEPKPAPATVDKPTAPKGTGVTAAMGELPFEAARGSLDVPITVKETQRADVGPFPLDVVVPLPFDQYQDTTPFRVVDAGGRPVPAQFQVLNRWWARGGSIRHLHIHFQPAVPAFTGPGTGLAVYHLRDDGPNPAPPTPVKVEETAERITVTTGPLRFTVAKQHFQLIESLWVDRNRDGAFSAEELVIKPSPANGGRLLGRKAGDVQADSGRRDVAFKIEESGPMRAVIRIEAPTLYDGPDKITHGFAVRLYAYAGQPMVKIDYQLQNSAKSTVYGWPLYFEAMDVGFDLNLAAAAEARVPAGQGTFARAIGGGIVAAQESDDHFRVLDSASGAELASGGRERVFMQVRDAAGSVTAIPRLAWEMWPKGVAVDGHGHLSFELFPAWSAQPERAKTNPTGLHYLWDMQHAYKEMLLAFHGPAVADADLRALARTFSLPPVPVLPLRWYRTTKATLPAYDGEFLANRAPIEDRDRSKQLYDAINMDRNKADYAFGWINFFGVDFYRRVRSCAVGSWPTSADYFIVDGDPRSYYQGAFHAMGEINHRPMWMSDYQYERDFDALRLDEAPYCGGSWRALTRGVEIPFLERPPLAGTERPWAARDNEHGWFYHVEEAYLYTANPWIRDWYEFVAEFRQAELYEKTPYPEKWNRGYAHGLTNALQAYRVTGNPKLFAAIRDSVYRKSIMAWDRLHGEPKGGFQSGFVMRAFSEFMNEVGRDDPGWWQGFQVVSQIAEWNITYGNFPYFYDIKKEYEAGKPSKSSLTAMTLIDPVSWYYWITGKEKYWDHLTTYMRTGINGGQKPTGKHYEWAGQFEGRVFPLVNSARKRRDDFTPPAAVKDLRVEVRGDELVLHWTAPPDADTAYYHLLFERKPIAEKMSEDPEQWNWWKARLVKDTPKPTPGQAQSVTVVRPKNDTDRYFALFAFDASGNMSAMSNVAAYRP